MKHLLAHLVTGKPLSAAQAEEAFTAIMAGEATAGQIGALLAIIQLRGVDPGELAGAARVMRANVAPVAVPPGMRVIDTCGTGGDQAHTFNISTATALVAAAAGYPRDVGVAKHGTRSITSRSGSSQVLEVLGVKLIVAPQTQTRCLQETGICFCFAPAHHPALKHAMPVRQDLGFRTLFNLVAPMTNPAGAKRQLMGVFAAGLTEPVARVLDELGSEHAMVVHGEMGEGRGIDELSTVGPSRISHLRGRQVQTYTLDAASLGLEPATPESLRVDGPEASAAVIRSVLRGEHGPARDIVCLNAAAALLVADLAADLGEGLRLAEQAVDSGAAERTLEALVRLTSEDAK